MINLGQRGIVHCCCYLQRTLQRYQVQVQLTARNDAAPGSLVCCGLVYLFISSFASPKKAE